MMKSLFSYHSLSKENSYLKKFKEKLGIERFNQVYDSFSKFLNENIKVNSNVYTDSEGLTYNSISLKH